MTADITTAQAFMGQLEGLLQRYAFRFGSEVIVHQAMAGIFIQAGYSFSQEYRFDDKNRADFYFPAEQVVIEVKVDGSLSEALRQCARYSAIEQVSGVLLVAATPWGVETLGELPALHGKHFSMVQLQRRIL